MATKLKRLKVKRVAFVDEGANPDAHIRFAKNRDGQPTVAEDAPTEAEKGVIKRLIESIAKAFGVEPVEKAAFTFAEGEEKRDYDKIMSGEVYPMSWAFMDSVSSILFDPQKSDEEKAALLKQSLSEFSTAFEGNVENWAKAQSAEAVVKEDVAVLEKMRDNISQLTERDTPYKMEQVFEVIDSRYGAKKPMIVTTNLSLQQMQNEPNIRQRRVYERIFEVCHPVEFNGPSWRWKAAENDYDEIEKLLLGE